VNDLEALRRDRDAARAELARVRAERDQLRLDLLRVSLPEPNSDRVAELTALRAQVARLSTLSVDLQRELDAHRATVSWRITAPLRMIRARHSAGNTRSISSV
jgi:multidrug resistance efflux pump